MQPDPLYVRGRSFLTRLIRQRDYITRNRIGLRSDCSVLQDCRYLKSNLEAQKYGTDEQMAKFLIRNDGRIRNILPGKLSAVYEPMMRTYIRLMDDAHDTIHQLNTISNESSY